MTIDRDELIVVNGPPLFGGHNMKYDHPDKLHIKSPEMAAILKPTTGPYAPDTDDDEESKFPYWKYGEQSPDGLGHRTLIGAVIHGDKNVSTGDKIMLGGEVLTITAIVSYGPNSEVEVELSNDRVISVEVACLGYELLEATYNPGG